MSKNSFGIFADAVLMKRLGKVVPFTFLEVTGPDAKAIVDAALGEKSRGDVTPNAAGTGYTVSGLSEKAALLALENCALVDVGEPAQGRKVEAEPAQAS